MNVSLEIKWTGSVRSSGNCASLALVLKSSRIYQKKVGENTGSARDIFEERTCSYLLDGLRWGSRCKLLRSHSVSHVKHGIKKSRPRSGKIGTKQVWNETSCLWSTICMYYAFDCANGANEWAHHTNRAECFVLAALLRELECCEEYDNIYVIENSSSNGCAQSNENVPFYGKTHYNTFRAWDSDSNDGAGFLSLCCFVFHGGKCENSAESRERWMSDVRLGDPKMPWHWRRPIGWRFYFCCSCYVEFSNWSLFRSLCFHEFSACTRVQVPISLKPIEPYIGFDTNAVQVENYNQFSTRSHTFWKKKKFASDVLPNADICVGTAVVRHRRCCRATRLAVFCFLFDALQRSKLDCRQRR